MVCLNSTDRVTLQHCLEVDVLSSNEETRRILGSFSKRKLAQDESSLRAGICFGQLHQIQVKIVGIMREGGVGSLIVHMINEGFVDSIRRGRGTDN